MAVEDCWKRENATPRRAIAEALGAINAVHAAFGAPGNYGYGHPEGQSLRWLYDCAQLLKPALDSLPKEAETAATRPPTLLDFPLDPRD
jgi:hypothetical protein